MPTKALYHSIRVGGTFTAQSQFTAFPVCASLARLTWIGRAAIWTPRTRDYLFADITQSLLNALPLGVVYLDSNFTIQVANNTISLMIGLDASHLVGSSIFEVSSRLKLKEFGKLPVADALLRGIVLRNQEIGVEHAVTGETRILLVSVTPVSASDSTAGPGSDRGFMGCVLSVEDITARKYLEVYNLQDSRDQLISEFASSTAHEIRNPLTTLRGFLQLQSKRDKPQGGKDYWQIMIDAVDRIDALMTEQMRTHGRGFASGWHTVPFPAVFDGLQQLVSVQSELAGVSLKVGPLPDVFIHTNIGEFKRLVLHLVTNALDAMKGGGVLSITNEVIGSWLLTVITDTGHGIDLEHLPYVFDPFFTTRPAHGGLGLTLARLIAHAHGGEIEFVPPAATAGCEVIVRLPHQGRAAYYGPAANGD